MKACINIFVQWGVGLKGQDPWQPTRTSLGHTLWWTPQAIVCLQLVPLSPQDACGREGDMLQTEVLGLPAISGVTGISADRMNGLSTRNSRVSRTDMRQRPGLETKSLPQPSTEYVSYLISFLQLATLGAVWLDLPLLPSLYPSFN